MTDDWAELLRDAPKPSLALQARKYTWQLELPVVEADFRRWGPLLRSFNESAAKVGQAHPTDENALGVARQLSPLPTFDEKAASALPAKPMTAVLKHRQTWLPHASSLPINKSKQEINDGARSSRVLLVVGDAGCGKSTQLPQYMAALDKKKRTIVVVSTELAAVALAARLTAETGDAVAIAAQNQIPPTSATMVVTTADVLIRALIADPALAQVASIVIDDIQHKSLAQEVLLTALKHSMLHANAGFRLVLACSSHSPHVERLVADYFGANNSASATGDAPALLHKVVIPAVHADTRATELCLEDVVSWVYADGNALPQDSTTESPPTLQALAASEKLKRGQSFDITAFSDDWTAFFLAAVRKYNAFADEAGVTRDQSAVAIILPTELHCRVLAKAFHDAGVRGVAAWGFDSETAVSDAFTTDGSNRLIVIAVARWFAGALAPSVPFGFVLDAGRESALSVDSASHVSKKVFELSSKLALKMRKDTVASASRRAPHRPLVATLLSADALRKNLKPQPLAAALSSSAEEWRECCLLLASFNENLLKANSATLVATGSYVTRVLSFCTPSSEEFRQHTAHVADCCAAAESWMTASGLLHVAPPAETAPRRVPTNLGRLCASFAMPLVAAKLLVTATVLGIPEAGAAMAAILVSRGLLKPLSTAEAEDSVAARRYAAGASQLQRSAGSAAAVSDVMAELRLFHLLEAEAADSVDLPARVAQVRACAGLLLRSLVQRGMVEDGAAVSAVQEADEELLSFCLATALYPNAAYLPPGTGKAAAAMIIADAGACDICAVSRPHLNATPVASTALDASANSAVAALTFVDAFVPAQSKAPVVAGLHHSAVVSCPLAAGSVSVLSGEPQSEVPTRRTVRAGRCRGWFAPVCTAWRSTPIAQSCITSDGAQIKPRPIPTKLWDVSQADLTVLAADSVMNVAVPSTTAHFIDKARIGMRVSFADAVAALSHSSRTATAKGTSKVAALPDFIDMLRWMLHRESTAHDYARERRKLNSNAPAKVRLLSAFPYTYNSTDLPHRRPNEEFAELSTVNGEESSGLQPSSGYTGPVPTDAETLAFINQAAKLTSARNSRDKEKDLLLSAPDKFAFLDYKHPFHGYYLMELKKLNPSIKVLGDDLNELREFLTQLEKTIQDEMDGRGKATVELPSQPAPPPTNTRLGGAVRAVIETSDREQQPYRPQPMPYQAHAATAPAPAPPSSSLFFSMDGQADDDDEEEPQEPPMSMQPSHFHPQGLPPPGVSPFGPGAPFHPVGSGYPYGHSAGLPPPPLSASGYPPHHHGGYPQPMDHGGAVPPPPAYNTSEGLLDPGTHPLAVPPPPIPIDPNADPSVLISPLPELKVATNDPLPLIIAKALGESLSLKVGPTLIVGNVARVTVPNRAVESRAIAKGTFYCLGQKCKITKNDRIFDNPGLLMLNKAKHDHIRRSLQTDVPRHLKRVAYSPERDGPAMPGSESLQPQHVFIQNAAPVPTVVVGVGHHHHHHHHAHAPVPGLMHHHHVHHHHHHHHHMMMPPPPFGVAPNMGYAVVGAEGSLGGGPMMGGRRRPPLVPPPSEQQQAPQSETSNTSAPQP